MMKHFYMALVDAPSSIQKVAVTNDLIANVFNVVMGLAGAVAVAFVVFGGIKYILSQGEPAEIKKARDTILYAVIGIVVVVSAFVVVNFVIGRF